MKVRQMKFTTAPAWCFGSSIANSAAVTLQSVRYSVDSRNSRELEESTYPTILQLETHFVCTLLHAKWLMPSTPISYLSLGLSRKHNIEYFLDHLMYM